MFAFFSRSSLFDRQVRLPRNQLFVTRVTGRTQLADLLHTVCNEKALDPRHYELRHPGMFAITPFDPPYQHTCVCVSRFGCNPLSDPSIQLGGRRWVG